MPTHQSQNTATYWINHLHLNRHPEGGWFAETYRATETIPALGQIEFVKPGAPSTYDASQAAAGDGYDPVGKRADGEAVAAAAAPADAKASPSQLAKEAMGIFDKATNLQRQGDWARYGDEIRRLGAILNELKGSAPAKPTTPKR